ncbi:MAG: hypothetical protein ACREM2_09405 [Vulcanimicrobiaceae bacterium]
MNRLFSALLAAAFVLTAGSSAFAAKATPKSHSMMTTHHMMAESCPKGETWVNGYTTKKGAKVKGYCRKASAKK